MAQPDKQVIAVPGLADGTSRSFAQCVVAGGLVFIAGQTGIDSEFHPVSLEFGPQTRQAFANLGRALSAVNADFDHVASMTVYLTRLDRDASEFLSIRREIMGGWSAASALIGVSLLGLPELLVEIQAIAVLPS